MRQTPAMVTAPSPLRRTGDFGRLGRAWRETDDDHTGRETLIRELLAGEYHPVRIVAFNTSEGWSRDVTVEIVDEVRRASSSTRICRCRCSIS